MKEKIKQIILRNKQFIKWVVLAIIIVGVVYFLFPKYYFIIDSGTVKGRCNEITGQCDARTSGNHWKALIK